MTVSGNLDRKCHNTINSSLKVFGLFTTARTSVCDYVMTEGNKAVTYSDIKTISSGIAVADAAVVGWQMDDLSRFPSNYVSSLVQGIGGDLMASASSSTPVPASLSTLPQ
jgi:hypothetical protein